MISGAGDAAVRYAVQIPEPRQETRMPTNARGLGSTLVSMVLVFLAAVGGLFLAAETDALPSGMQAAAHRAFGAPGPAVFGERTKKQRNRAAPVASPVAVAPSESIADLCPAFQKASPAVRSAGMQGRFHQLVIAAGGETKVVAFCAALTPAG